MQIASYETVTVRGDGLTVSLIVWRRFRRQMPGLVEAALDANQGLAQAGPVLPVGLTFSLPIPAQVTDQSPADRISLW